jgi:hypothetical protein
VTVLFGRVGALTLLNSVGRGLDVSLDLPGVLHEIAGSRGGRVVQRMGAEKRTFTFSKNHLTADDLSVIEGYALGAYGPGPFVLIDSARRNLLTANVSSGSDVLGDTTGIRALTGSISSTTVQAAQGVRSIAWPVTAANMQVMTGAAAGGVADPAVDIPVLPSTAYSAQVKGRLLGSTGSIRPDIYWYTAAGVLISSTAGTATALAAGSFTLAPIINAASPSTAALARLLVQNTAFGVATTIYLDQFQMEQATTNSAWVLGTGVPRVSFIDKIAQSYLAQPYVDASVSLVEV